MPRGALQFNSIIYSFVRKMFNSHLSHSRNYRTIKKSMSDIIHAIKQSNKNNVAVNSFLQSYAT